jgi:integrase
MPLDRIESAIRKAWLTMASIRRRTDRSGRWQATVRIDSRERSKTFGTKREAEDWVAQLKAAVARGEYLDPSAGRALFGEIAAAWLASNPNKRPTTYARDAAVIRTHLLPAIGEVPIGKLRPSHAKAVVDRMVVKGLAPKTMTTNYGVLRAICAWAVADDMIARTPCRGVRLPEVRNSGKPVAGADDVRRLIDAIDPEYRAAVHLGVMGLRLAEVVGLRIGSIDFLRRTLTVRDTINEVEGRFVDGTGKTEAAQRTLSVPQSVLDVLAEHIRRTGRSDPSALLLQAPGGGPIRATNFRRRVYNPALHKAGLEGLTFHRLRHSAGHLMREAGVPLEVIQKRLGHRSIRTTADVYGSLPESVDRAVADQLEQILNFRGPNADHGRETGRAI